VSTTPAAQTPPPAANRKRKQKAHVSWRSPIIEKKIRPPKGLTNSTLRIHLYKAATAGRGLCSPRWYALRSGGWGNAPVASPRALSSRTPPHRSHLCNLPPNSCKMPQIMPYPTPFCWPPRPSCVS
jgi:hypothetical protein